VVLKKILWDFGVVCLNAPYYIANQSSLEKTISQFKWQCDYQVFKNLLAAVQVVTSIRAGKLRREPKKKD